MTALFSAVILFSCTHSTSQQQQQKLPATVTDSLPSTKHIITTKPDFDSTIVVQNQNFRVQLWVDTSFTSDEERQNTFLLIQRDNQEILSDSLSTQIDMTDVEFVDLNKDGNMDISILKESGGRMANIFAHWLLYNKVTRSFNRIAGIDQLPTVDQDSTGLVIAHAFYGELTNESYYFINKDFKLIDLKEEAETLEFDDTTDLSEKTFNKALQKYHQQKDR